MTLILSKQGNKRVFPENVVFFQIILHAAKPLLASSSSLMLIFHFQVTKINSVAPVQENCRSGVMVVWETRGCSIWDLCVRVRVVRLTNSFFILFSVCISSCCREVADRSQTGHLFQSERHKT